VRFAAGDSCCPGRRPNPSLDPPVDHHTRGRSTSVSTGRRRLTQGNSRQTSRRPRMVAMRQAWACALTVVDLPLGGGARPVVEARWDWASGRFVEIVSAFSVILAPGITEIADPVLVGRRDHRSSQRRWPIWSAPGGCGGRCAVSGPVPSARSMYRRRPVEGRARHPSMITCLRFHRSSSMCPEPSGVGLGWQGEAGLGSALFGLRPPPGNSPAVNHPPSNKPWPIWPAPCAHHVQVAANRCGPPLPAAPGCGRG
jgi:hypothetical protein